MKPIKIVVGLLLTASFDGALAAGCPCDDPANVCTFLDSGTLSILNEQDGWASDGDGVTGGADGNQIYWVTTLDEDTGPGTLRSALKASGSCPLWIKFSVSGKIKLKDEIQVNSNKTLDGRGADIVIDTNTNMTPSECASGSGGVKTDGLVIENEKNVAIFNIEFNDDFEYWDGDCDGSDGIRIEDSHHVWIYHNTFKKWADGGIDINTGSDQVTIAWNEFKKIYQGVAIRDGNTTFHHNYCDEVYFRCPHANYSSVNSANGVYVHTFNNYIRNWHGENIIHAKGTDATLLSEYDMFLSGVLTTSSLIDATKDGGVADIRSAHDFGGGLSFEENGQAEQNWRVYSRSLINKDTCSDDSCFNDLADEVKLEAGDTL